MIRLFVSLVFILVLISCEPVTESADYMGQPYPSSIPVVFAPGIVSMKGRLEHGISFTPDTKESVFGILNEEDFGGQILYSKKVDKSWTEPATFEPLKNRSTYLPYFSPNGESLLYAESKPGTNNGYTDIGIITRIEGGWSSSNIIQTPLSSESREANACMTYDGTIYFSSNRNCQNKENCYTADLFYSKLIKDEYESAEVISEFSSENDEESVFISPNEEYIIFCRYTDSITSVDLYISYRDINGNWLEPTILDGTINSEYWDRRPFVSIDNKFLFFTQLQIGEKGLAESDIFWVNTSRLFKPFAYNPIPDMTFQIGEKFEISVPTNYFEDIDGNLLELSISEGALDWIEFDSEEMKLSGLPTIEGDFELTFSAVDEFANMTKDIVKLQVEPHLSKTLFK